MKEYGGNRKNRPLWEEQWLLADMRELVEDVTVFLPFLSSPYKLTISPSTYGYNITWSPMWLILTCLISDLFHLGYYSTSRQLSLGAVPCIPTYPFMDALALVYCLHSMVCAQVLTVYKGTLLYFHSPASSMQSSIFSSPSTCLSVNLGSETSLHLSESLHYSRVCTSRLGLTPQA